MGQRLNFCWQFSVSEITAEYQIELTRTSQLLEDRVGILLSIEVNRLFPRQTDSFIIFIYNIVRYPKLEDYS